MLKKISYSIVLLGLLALALFLIVIAPFHIYTTTLTEGVNTRFLQMSPSPKAFYDGQKLTMNDAEKMIDKNLFESVHFNNFLMPLPMNHPQFSLIPIIRIEGKGPRLGASFQNSKGTEFFSFIVERPFKFETTHGDQKIFNLPFFKNYILRKNQKEMWKDLFEKKLSLPSNEGKSFLESLSTIYRVSYQELVYNLFILFNRRFLASNDLKSLIFYPEREMGIIELKSADPKMRIEKIFIIENNLIYPMLIKTKTNELSAENFRAKLLSEIVHKKTSTESAIPIYARYKQLSYDKRIDQLGMAYLYAAWSHDLSNKDFVRVIILFLERGKLNLKYLKPFYEFAFKKFGSSLSSESGYLEETPAEKLKRRISEDLEKEIKLEEEKSVEKTPELFSSEEDRIKFNLQKAKDKKINSDDGEKILTIE